MKSRLLRLIGGFGALTLIATYPLWLQASQSVPGDIGDPVLNSWILAWDAHAILVAPGHIFDANIFFPLPNTLAYSEHLLSSALLLLPLQILSRQPILVYNANLLLAFILSACGMYLLTLRWTQQHPAALAAGAAFAFAPYRLAAIAHLQLLTLQWLPFALLALDGVLTTGGRRRRRWAVLLTLFLGLQVLASWYLAVFSALILGVYLLVWLCTPLTTADQTRLAGKGRSLLYVVGGLMVVAICCLPAALPYLQTMPALLSTRPPEMAASLAARPQDFLAATPTHWLLGPLTATFRQRPAFTQENTLYPGLVILLLALTGLASAAARFRPASARQTGPPWRIAALSLAAIVSIALTFEQPYLALIRLLPQAQVVRVPARWMIPAAFALAALAGFGLAAVSRWLQPGPKHMRSLRETPRTWGLAAVFTALILVESLAIPLPLAQPHPDAAQQSVYDVLKRQAVADLPTTWGIIELPMYVAPLPEYPETKRLLASTSGWWGLVNGYSGLTPPRQTDLAGKMSDFPDPTALEALRGLAEQDVRYLVVHPDQAPLHVATWQQQDRWLAEANPILLPAGQWGSAFLYLINPYGDQLVTSPTVVIDPFWVSWKPQTANITFSSPAGESISLLATHIRRGPSDAQLTLYWRANTPVVDNFTVFVHSLDSTGAIRAQADSPPLAGVYPTSAWQPGQVVQDSRILPAGQSYMVGMYNPLDGARVAAFSSSGEALPDNAVQLFP